MLVEPDPAADCTAQLRPLAPRAARFVHIMVPHRASNVGLLPLRKPNPIAGRRTRHRGACGFSEIIRCASSGIGNGILATRSLQHYLGHKNIQHTVRYSELSPERFRDFWKDQGTFG
jgi:hypothetical protein